MENPRLETVENQEVIELEDGVRLRLPAPTEIPKGFRYEPAGDFLLEKCQAAWSSSGEHDLPLNFRLVGQPGVGKNALVYELARQRKQPLYIVLGNEEFTAEDLVVSAAIHDNQRVEYIASTLLAAMIAGGICFIDEIAKMRPRSQAPLASLTDDRRTIYSALLARWFKAKPSFRFCAAYNPTDADSFDLAPWLKSRTLPEFEVKRPSWEVLERIVISRNPEWHQMAQDTIARVRRRKIRLDPGQLLRVVSFADRIARYQREIGRELGDPFEIAVAHILDSERKGKGNK